MGRSTLKKVMLIAIIIFAVILTTTTVNAFSVGMDLTSDTKTLKPGDTVAIKINLKDIDAGNGIDTVIAQLDYDTNVFEEVTKKSFTEENDWDLTYAKETKKLSVQKTEKVKSNELILTLNLQVKSAVSLTTTTVTLKDIVVSGGRVVNGGTDDITVPNASITFAVEANVKEEPTKPSTETKNNPTTSTETNKNTATQTTTTTTKNTTNTKVNTATSTNSTKNADKSTAKSIIPKTGVSQTVVTIISIVVLVGIICFILYKKTSKEVK